MAWPGLGKCTAYPSLGQDSLPLGVRWFSDGLGLARGSTMFEEVSWTRATKATLFRLTAEQGRYSAAAATAKTPAARCARRGAAQRYRLLPWSGRPLAE